MVAPLTPTQRRVLDFLREFVERHRFAPTAREVAGRFGIAVKNGFYYLEVLERKGYIRRKRHHPRRIEFVGEGLSRPAVRIPVLGRVPAGGPREAVEEVEGEMLLDPGLAGGGEGGGARGGPRCGRGPPRFFAGRGGWPSRAGAGSTRTRSPGRPGRGG